MRHSALKLRDPQEPDPTAGFPGGTRFAPYAALRNTTANPLEVAATLNFMAGGTPKTVALPPWQLKPYETRFFSLDSLLQASGLKNLPDSVNLAVSLDGRAGDLVLATGSVDQSGTYVFEVEPQGVGPSFSKEAAYWKVADGFDTMFTLWNPTDQAQDFLVTFFFGEEEARYKLPESLGPKASTTIDVSKVIAAQQPDPDGHTIPLTVREGSAAISSAKGMTEPMTLVHQRRRVQRSGRHLRLQLYQLLRIYWLRRSPQSPFLPLRGLRVREV